MYHFSSRNLSREAVKAIKHLNPQVHRECHCSDVLLNRKGKLFGRDPPASSKLLRLPHSFQHSPTHSPVCPIYTWCPNGKLVPNRSATWFFQWQHIVRSLPTTTQKLEFNHLSLNHLINKSCPRHPGLPSALSKVSALGKVHRLFLRFHAVILLNFLGLLKSSFLPHGPGKNKGRKKKKD